AFSPWRILLLAVVRRKARAGSLGIRRCHYFLGSAGEAALFARRILPVGEAPARLRRARRRRSDPRRRTLSRGEARSAAERCRPMGAPRREARGERAPGGGPRAGAPRGARDRREGRPLARP